VRIGSFRIKRLVPETLFESEGKSKSCAISNHARLLLELILVVVGSSSLDGTVSFELAELPCRVMLYFALACH
jgi:hypothetical protein